MAESDSEKEQGYLCPARFCYYSVTSLRLHHHFSVNVPFHRLFLNRTTPVIPDTHHSPLVLITLSAFFRPGLKRFCRCTSLHSSFSTGYLLQDLDIRMWLPSPDVIYSCSSSEDIFTFVTFCFSPIKKNHRQISTRWKPRSSLLLPCVNLTHLQRPSPSSVLRLLPVV